MALSWHDLILPEDAVDEQAVLEAWSFIMDKPMEGIVLASAFGDCFFQGQDEAIYFLDMTEGTFQKVLDKADDLEEALKNPDLLNEWFMPDILAELLATMPMRNRMSSYSTKLLPALGGKYEQGNYQLSSHKEHSQKCADFFRKHKG